MSTDECKSNIAITEQDLKRFAKMANLSYDDVKNIGQDTKKETVDSKELNSATDLKLDLKLKAKSTMWELVCDLLDRKSNLCGLRDDIELTQVYHFLQDMYTWKYPCKDWCAKELMKKLKKKRKKKVKKVKCNCKTSSQRQEEVEKKMLLYKFLDSVLVGIHEVLSPMYTDLKTERTNEKLEALALALDKHEHLKKLGMRKKLRKLNEAAKFAIWKHTAELADLADNYFSVSFLPTNVMNLVRKTSKDISLMSASGTLAELDPVSYATDIMSKADMSEVMEHVANSDDLLQVLSSSVSRAMRDARKHGMTLPSNLTAIQEKLSWALPSATSK